MRKLRKLWIVGLVLLWATSARANSILVQGAWEHTPNSNYGDGVGVVARVEAPIYKDLSAGLEGAYHGLADYGSGSVSGYSLLPELSYHPKFGWKIKPYVLGGWGWSWWHFDPNQDTKDREITIDLGNSFAQKYAIGADYQINSNWDFNLEWAYFHSFAPKEGHNPDGSNSIALTDGSTIGIEQMSLLAGLRYKW